MQSFGARVYLKWQCNLQVQKTLHSMESLVGKQYMAAMSGSAKFVSSLNVTEEQWMFLVVTLGGCSGRTRWSSSLDCSPTYTTTTVAVP